MEGDFLSRLISACDFSLMANETTNTADRVEFSIFMRYVDSDSHEVKEDFLGLVEVVGSKRVEALFKLICEVLPDKEVEINQMRFNGFDGKNTMGGEISELQRQFHYLVPHSKHINCRNHRLALVFAIYCQSIKL